MNGRLHLVALLIAVLAGACVAPAARSPGTSQAGEIRVGAVFPLEGDAAALAGQQLLGTRIAAEFANAAGGIAGRRVVLDVRNLDSGGDADAVMRSLREAGARVVIGAYSSELSIAASRAADSAGLVYWEAGAVADQLTGRGLPRVFRVGASGTNLGSNSAAFAAAELARRLGKTAQQMRVAFVNAQDDYARSVADAAASTATSKGLPVVSRTSYSLSAPAWGDIMSELARSRPDVIILASHIPDGIAFRRAMLAANLRVGALIGSTMAQCDPDFAGDLGPDAVGIFASDRPTGGFQPSALGPAARALYDRLAVAWAARTDGPREPGRYATLHPASSTAEYTITGPVEAGSSAAGPSEEGLSGFSAAWALFHDVLPTAIRSGRLDGAAVAAAARSIDLPTGSLPNGAGLRFSVDPARLGQNERAAAVIWQWQAVRTYAFVWPPTYATGSIDFVPLQR